MNTLLFGGLNTSIILFMFAVLHSMLYFGTFIYFPENICLENLNQSLSSALY